MTLRELRKQFVRMSGRYDLVSPSYNQSGQLVPDEWDNNGADFYIQAGHRFLDRQGDFDTGHMAQCLLGLSADQEEVFISACWQITSVHYRLNIDPKGTWRDIENVYSPDALCCKTKRIPYFYLIPNLVFPFEGARPLTEAKIPASELNLRANYSAGETKGLTIHIVNKPKTPTTIKVIGHFYTQELEKDSDTNYWSIYHPEILLKAAMYELEIFYRNSEGANDWLTALTLDMRTLQESELMGSLSTTHSEMGL